MVSGRGSADSLRVRGEHAVHPLQLCLLQQGRDCLPHPRGRKVSSSYFFTCCATNLHLQFKAELKYHAFWLQYAAHLTTL